MLYMYMTPICTFVKEMKHCTPMHCEWRWIVICHLKIQHQCAAQNFSAGYFVGKGMSDSFLLSHHAMFLVQYRWNAGSVLAWNSKWINTFWQKLTQLKFFVLATSIIFMYLYFGGRLVMSQSVMTELHYSKFIKICHCWIWLWILS